MCVCVSLSVFVSVARMQRELAEHAPLRLDMLQKMENTPQTPPKKFTSLSFPPYPHTIFDLPNPRLLLFLIHPPVPASLQPSCWLCLFSPKLDSEAALFTKGSTSIPLFFSRLLLFFCLLANAIVRGETGREVARGMEGIGAEWPPLDSDAVSSHLRSNKIVLYDAWHISSFILCLLFLERWKQKDGCVMSLWDLVVGSLIGDDWVAPLGYALHPMKWPPSLYSSPE